MGLLVIAALASFFSQLQEEVQWSSFHLLLMLDVWFLTGLQRFLMQRSIDRERFKVAVGDITQFYIYNKNNDNNNVISNQIHAEKNTQTIRDVLLDSDKLELNLDSGPIQTKPAISHHKSRLFCPPPPQNGDILLCHRCRHQQA